MASQIFRSNNLAACATCGAEWFGRGGEAVARAHALATGHQVQLEILHRETINPAPTYEIPRYEPVVAPSATHVGRAVDAAKHRVSLFDGAIGKRQQVAR